MESLLDESPVFVFDLDLSHCVSSSFRLFLHHLVDQRDELKLRLPFMKLMGD